MTIDASVTVPPYNTYFHRGSPLGGVGGGGDSHVKVMGMPIVLLRGVHCTFWFHLGVFKMESHYIWPFRYCLGMCIKKVTNNPTMSVLVSSHLGVNLS